MGSSSKNSAGVGDFFRIVGFIAAASSYKSSISSSDESTLIKSAPGFRGELAACLSILRCMGSSSIALAS